MYLILGLAVLTVPGCRGCRHEETTQDEQEAKERERAKLAEEKPKPDFEPAQSAIQPGEFSPTLGGRSFYKPGHWMCATLATKTNNFDFVGELDLSVTGHEGTPGGLVATPFELSSVRPIALPKGQAKTFEAAIFFPADGHKAQASYRIQAHRGGYDRLEARDLLTVMPAHQYFLVVWARDPDRYAYLRDGHRLQAVNGMEVDVPNYRVSYFLGDRRPPLPAHALFWTSIAYLIWDDVEPSILDEEQRQALIDWLHWGGQLIVSGPDSLATLSDSFLKPYLPATDGGACELSAEDLRALAQFGEGQPLQPIKPWAGRKLVPRPEASYLAGCGNLLVERRVGRGRILVSAFALANRELSRWHGIDGLMNCCLLRHLPRRFLAAKAEDFNEGTDMCWVSGDATLSRFDPEQTSRLRYFTRDAGAAHPASKVGFSTDESETPEDGAGTNNRAIAPTLADADACTKATGVAGWNDFSPVACTARNALQEAARVKVPGRMFVVWTVAIYLLVLVPLNWFIFRMLGRVEWAWAAAPLIALGGTVLVIHFAQLDIGFVRARTEIIVAELQPGCPRAHVTRYTALYSSLTTQYIFRSDKDPGAIVQPFPTVAKAADFHLTGDRTRLLYQRDDSATLSGFSVSSNATGFVHSEQMIDLGGSISLSQDSQRQLVVSNGTRFPLQDAIVVLGSDTQPGQMAALGTVAPGDRAIAELVEKENSPQESSPSELRALFAAGQQQGLAPGEARLVAWIDRELSGQTVEPDASQVVRHVLVVAHLRYAPEPDPLPDVNAPARSTPKALEQ